MRSPCGCGGGRVQAVAVELTFGGFEADREGKSCSLGAAGNVS